MAANTNGGNVIESLLKGANTLISSKTVVGEPTVIEDTILVPLVDVSFGIGIGTGKSDKRDSGMGGMSGKMSPNAILMIKNGQTRLINVKNQDNVTKIVDMIPDLVDRFMTKREEMPSDEAAREAAFPETEE